jgi:hypothetical protein
MYYKSSKTVMQFAVIHLKIKKDYVYMVETWKTIYQPRNLWVSNREDSLIERKAELDTCTVAAWEGQRTAPQSWDTVACISYITASLAIHLSFWFPFLRVRAPEINRALHDQDRNT